jgi:5-amino-6-(5-phosphoribosylamino)uracil reductase
LPYFAQPLQRWLLTDPCRTGGTAAGFQRTLPLRDWPTTLADLAQAGIGRVVLLGGAGLLGSMLAADAVDELQLTVCPTLLGGGHVWLPPGFAAPARWRCLGVVPLGEGEVLLRYGRER